MGLAWIAAQARSSARCEASSHPLLRGVFWVWDQIDLLTTAWPLLAFWVRPTALLVATSVVLTLALQPLVALVGYLLGARRTAR
jgi:hypothetical protein